MECEGNLIYPVAVVPPDANSPPSTSFAPLPAPAELDEKIRLMSAAAEGALDGEIYVLIIFKVFVRERNGNRAVGYLLPLSGWAEENEANDVIRDRIFAV